MQLVRRIVKSVNNQRTIQFSHSNINCIFYKLEVFTGGYNKGEYFKVLIRYILTTKVKTNRLPHKTDLEEPTAPASHITIYTILGGLSLRIGPYANCEHDLKSLFVVIL